MLLGLLLGTSGFRLFAFGVVWYSCALVGCVCLVFVVVDSRVLHLRFDCFYWTLCGVGFEVSVGWVCYLVLWFISFGYGG